MFQYGDIGKGKKPYIIAEIGSNHNGEMELAKKMICEAKRCGADCVKFQSWTKNSIFSKKVYEDNYFLRDDYRNRTDYTLEEIVDKYHIGVEEHHELKKYCDQIEIDFNSTPFSKAETDLLVDELQVPFIKIASMDLTNIPFLKYIASKERPVVMSTGLGSLQDVAAAVECLESNGCKEIVLLHCVSIYPPENNQVNLNNIDMLRMNFNYPVGYSDHTLGVVAPILSIAKDVCIIEKHFTLDKEMEGWDHKVSANPEELKQISDAAECGYEMIGTYQKVVNENQERREAFQRSIVAARDIAEGHIIEERDLDYKRPGSGISPKYFEFIIGKEAKRHICMDEMLKMEDF